MPDCNFLVRYIEDVLSLNNSKFSDYVDRINPTEIGIRDITDTATIVSYHDLHPKIYNEERIRTKHYDYKMISILRLGNFHFYVATFKQNLYRKHMSPSWYDIPVFLVVNLKSSFRAFYGHHHHFVQHCEIYVSQVTLWYSQQFRFILRVCNKSSCTYIVFILQCQMVQNIYQIVRKEFRTIRSMCSRHHKCHIAI